MIPGNVIFPAFEAAYLSWAFLFPLAAIVLVVEGGLLWCFNRDTPLGTLWLCVIGMNIVSYLAGIFLVPWLFIGSGLIVENPDAAGYGILARAADWQALSQWSFLQAAILSAAIEMGVLLPLWKIGRLRRVVVPVVLGNCIGYVLLFSGFQALTGAWG